MTQHRPARVLTGDRPTGHLHLGHYFGTIANRVRLQRAGHEIFLVIADYQVIADRDHPGDLRTTSLDLVADYLACGLDPERTVIFPHSQVPALNQLLLPFLSLVSVPELERNPTVKEEAALSGRAQVSGLMLTYPVHQAADILFCGAGLVPVGRDQLPHLELTRSIARRFNQRYGPTFVLPDPLLDEVEILPGLDGQKMAKSRGNGISLRDTDEEIIQALRRSPTDSERRITFEPDRRPAVANLVRLGAVCSGCSPATFAEAVGASGGAGLKKLVAEAVIEFLTPIRRRRADVTRAQVEEILRRGIAAAEVEAARRLDAVRTAMGMDYFTD